MASSTKQEQPTAATQRKALEQAAKKREAEQRKLAERIAKIRAGTATGADADIWKSWDGDDGIVDSGLVKSAIAGRALLRKYELAAKAGGIGPSYNREEAKLKREQAQTA